MGTYEQGEWISDPRGKVCARVDQLCCFATGVDATASLLMQVPVWMGRAWMVGLDDVIETNKRERRVKSINRGLDGGLMSGCK